MSASLVKTSVKLQAQLQSIPPVPWRDPQSVSPDEIRGYIQTLEAACLENPQSADLHTCLGMAYAVDLAQNTWQLSLARRQLQEIRQLSRDSLRNVTWDKPLTIPALVLSALLLVMFAAMTWA